MTIPAYGANAADRPLEPMQIERRTPGANDVQIEIAFSVTDPCQFRYAD